ncbi:hypothetical protein H5T58_02600 [Candidatus Parcubacteria bacterium]|nr:hypothetical protein [Candidatus Parcubacteria bacterium]
MTRRKWDFWEMIDRKPGKRALDIGKVKQAILILDLGNMRFFATAKNREFLEEVATNLRKYHLNAKFYILPFGVRIKTVDPETNRAIDWVAEEGFSLWYSPVDALDSPYIS